MSRQGKIVVLMGSKRDSEFASRIGDFLKRESFDVDCEYVVASAHRTPRRLLQEVEKFDAARERVVFVAVAGLSDALSGVVAGSTRHPVVACPPDSEKYWWAKFFSSAMTPQGIAVAYVPRPENAALHAVKMLALCNGQLQSTVETYMKKMREATLNPQRKRKSV